ncbi:hypothetical protein PVK06_031531 [Gossypium arboreum]|uniref:RNase H type-1 domain-containing protein n=1 Tax=Gossypium arboreum TaxID=29729 RepID=A0ABR0NR93_GOSAR|nr:hypothetical protein PVK06_031531 [Gossypium arboreum]
MASCVHQHPYRLDVFMVEAMASVSALSFSEELGFLHVEIEGDSLTAIKKFRTSGVDCSTISAFVKYGKDIGNQSLHLEIGFG